MIAIDPSDSYSQAGKISSCEIRHLVNSDLLHYVIQQEKSRKFLYGIEQVF